MELVKRLEGSQPESIDYAFEDEYRDEDRRTAKRKKGILLGILILLLITILSYFGYKNFNQKEIKSKETNTILANLPTTVQPMQEVVSEPAPLIGKKPELLQSEIVIQDKIKNKSPIKKEIPKIEETVVYTEVLAQALKPELAQKTVLKPTLIKVKVPTPPKIVKKTVQVKKKLVKKVIKKPIPKKVSRKIRIIIVKKGDTLAQLSKKFYGSTKEFNRIIRANRNIKSHKTNLKIGQKIVIPYLKKYKVKKITTKKRRMITVKKGYSLAYISKKFYGNINEVQKIVNANKKIKNKNSTLRIGQKIYLPR